MTTTVALYGHWICPFVTRVRFTLAQRGIEHELVNVPPSGVRPRDFVLPDAFVEHSPRLGRSNRTARGAAISGPGPRSSGALSRRTSS
ncbi:MAG: glutathione S-transferase N-terminal domain-containing protein [Acidimicrobiia bacterium]|nr:glutathione S-transferase N-terminal domain-containing protein [Acidimicrobiia bacterium]